ncbi:MAG: rod shape-determining protein MreC [Bacteroidetes bacterium]|nr:MAG: rod shape-determining protein MreC [Bacteroidota bacterium]TAE62207.1 MAG: rod shape-determining protein MreC [Bacteroidota bacterium]TAF88664.1 MAG: rod shape-determining protein MreC [Bacteroidota bacterium]
MRNIFIFIQRYFIFFSFLLLQIVCWSFIVRFNSTHEAIFANASNEWVGFLETQYNKVQYFLNLAKANEQLAQENAALRNSLSASFDDPIETQLQRVDSTYLPDSSKKTRKYQVLPAKVVNSSITEENNYITLYRGSNQGVRKDMGVIGSNGVVGKVILVSENYSRVMSLLNRQMKVSAMLKKDGYTGIVDWDGANPQIVLLHNIPKSSQVKLGDSVVTSNYSGNFPPGVLVGTVQKIDADKASNFYNLHVKTATNFFNLQFAYLVQNTVLNEQQQLEAQTPKLQ